MSGGYSADDHLAAGGVQVVEVVVETGVGEELHGRFEAHLEGRRGVVLHAASADRRDDAVHRDVVGYQKQVAQVHADAVVLEDSADFFDEAISSSFDLGESVLRRKS